MTTNNKRRGGKILEVLTGSNGLVSAAVVILGFLTATLLLLVIGRNPAGMYQAMVQVVSGFDSRRGTWNARYVGEWLTASVPLALCALSFAFSARAGLFNIGAEGQYIAGLTAAQLIALFFPRAAVFHLFTAVLAAMLAGALFGAIAGFLKARFKVSEVVSTIMMNYIALNIHRIITLRIPGSTTYKTPDFPPTASLSNPILSSVTNGSMLNNGIFLAAASIFIYWLVMEKTTFGFSIRAAGFNRDAARYAGINVNANTAAAMAVSGAFAGLAGAAVSLGIFMHGRILSSFSNYGFDGIAVALGGGCTAIGISVMGLLFGMLKTAQPLMQSRQIPMEIASIILGLVVVFISLRSGIQIFAGWYKKKKTWQGESADG